MEVKIRISKRTLCIILSCILIFSITGSVSATVAKKNLALTYNNIKIKVNGTAITPTDASGNAVEPFVINGTTYLPVRAVANAMGMNVSWNAENCTVSLDKKTATNSYYADAAFIYGKLAETSAQISGLNQQIFALSMMIMSSETTGKSAMENISKEHKNSISSLKTMVNEMSAFVVAYSKSERSAYFGDAETLCDKLYVSMTYIDALSATNDYFISCMGDSNTISSDEYSTAVENAKNSYSAAYEYTNSVTATADSDFYDVLHKVN